MSIFHKAIIAGAVEIARAEKEDPELSCVLFEPDGSVVACNRWALYAASPTTAKSLPFTHDEKLFSAQAFPLVQLVELLKAIPQDKQFRGMLEHVQIIKSDINKHEARIHDGRGIKPIVLRSTNPHPALRSWRERFASLREDAGMRFMYNRKRLASAVEAVEAACKYDGEFAFVEQRPFKNGLLWRALNELTGQMVLLAWIVPAIDKTVAVSAWESSLFSVPKPMGRTLLRRTR